MKTVCIDYDQTYTAFKALCDLVIDKQTEFGYKAIMCTMRYPSETNDELEKLSSRINVYFSSRQAKKLYLHSLDIHPDIWIDDTPLWIYQNG